MICVYFESGKIIQDYSAIAVHQKTGKWLKIYPEDVLISSDEYERRKNINDWLILGETQYWAKKNKKIKKP